MSAVMSINLPYQTDTEVGRVMDEKMQGTEEWGSGLGHGNHKGLTM